MSNPVVNPSLIPRADGTVLEPPPTVTQRIDEALIMLTDAVRMVGSCEGGADILTQALLKMGDASIKLEEAKRIIQHSRCEAQAQIDRL